MFLAKLLLPRWPPSPSPTPSGTFHELTRVRWTARATTQINVILGRLFLLKWRAIATPTSRVLAAQRNVGRYQGMPKSNPSHAVTED
jgi:hypothetical protein